MNTIFIGGSRHVSRLPAEVIKRLDNVIASGHRVIVGDAAGVDKAVQKYFLDKQYDKVTVFCSGAAPRNHFGTWNIYHVDAPKNAKGYQFYAAKDREMARVADFGLMIWDGKSFGTILNALRLALAGKITVLFNVPEKAVINIKKLEDWKAFIARCSRTFQNHIKERTILDEWRLVEANDQPSLLSTIENGSITPNESASAAVTASSPLPNPPVFDQAVKTLNEALARGDATAIMNMIGVIARDRGMSHVARDTGLARESLYRSLDAKGNPEFATVLKVLSSFGLRLQVKSDQVERAREPIGSG